MVSTKTLKVALELGNAWKPEVLRYILEKAYIALNVLLKASLMTAQKGKIRAIAMEARALPRRAMYVGPCQTIDQ